MAKTELNVQAPAAPAKPAEQAKPTLREKIKETFSASVKAQLAGDQDHGWLQADSIAVVEDILAEDGKAKGYAPSEEALEFIAFVVNPSAFRQRLESKGLLKPMEKAKGRRSVDMGL